MSSVLEMALEAFEKIALRPWHSQVRAIAEQQVAALKEAVKTQGEPVAFIHRTKRQDHLSFFNSLDTISAHETYLETVALCPCTSAPTIPEGWQQATHANAPKYGERVIVLTTDADGDPIPEFAHYNGELGFLGIGGKRIKPVSYWMPSPAAPKGDKP